MKIVDGQNLILGRVAGQIAKEALEGEEVVLINCEKIVITGKPRKNIKKYKEKIKKGGPLRGPKKYKKPNQFVRRTIRGMLPYKKKRGKDALRKIKCYTGTPKELKDKEAQTYKEHNIEKVPNLYYITVEKICQEIGYQK